MKINIINSDKEYNQNQLYKIFCNIIKKDLEKKENKNKNEDKKE